MGDARSVRLTPRFLRQLRAHGAIPTTALSRDVGRTVASLVAAPLPTDADECVVIPPVEHAWVGRVEGHAAWIYFRFTDREVVLLTITRRQP